MRRRGVYYGTTRIQLDLMDTKEQNFEVGSEAVLAPGLPRPKWYLYADKIGEKSESTKQERKRRGEESKSEQGAIDGNNNYKSLKQTRRQKSECEKVRPGGKSLAQERTAAQERGKSQL